MGPCYGVYVVCARINPLRELNRGHAINCSLILFSDLLFPYYKLFLLQFVYYESHFTQ